MSYPDKNFVVSLSLKHKFIGNHDNFHNLVHHVYIFQFIGTPHWMAPEVIQESRYDGKVTSPSLLPPSVSKQYFWCGKHQAHPCI